MNYNITVLQGEELKKYQLEILKMAQEIIQIFDQNNIDYSLSGGSVLGAVRHNGFIPWDDDIDINIPRKDYKKMIDIFLNHEKYYVQLPDKYPTVGILVTQIRKKGTIARRQFDWNTNPCGLSIDIFVVENTFDNSFLRLCQGMLSEGIGFVVSSIRTYRNRKLPDEIANVEAKPIRHKWAKYILGFVCQIIPMQIWINMVDKVNSMCNDSNSKYVTIPTGRRHFFGEVLKRTDLLCYKRILFENNLWNIPLNYKEYLTQLYGPNYMVIPEMDKRECHAFLELNYGIEK